MRKIIMLLTILFAINTISISQEWMKQITKSDNKENLTLNDYQKAFNDYWSKYNVNDGKYIEEGKLVKAPGWKLFKRWEYYWESRVNNSTGEFPNTSTANELRKHKRENKTGTLKAGGAWACLGTSSSLGGYSGIGRINCIAFHPSDNNTFWVGAPSGGIWRTTDGGATWTVLSDNNEVLGVSAIAVSSNFSVDNTLYIATGDRDGGSSWSLGGGNSNDNNSVGVLKSTDGGATWTSTGLIDDVANRNRIGSLLIHPSDPTILYAGLEDGIYKTTNGGTDWNLNYQTDEYVIDMEFKPGDPNTVYASTKDRWGHSPKIFRTINAGIDWTLEHTFGTSDTRIELAVSGAFGTTDDNIVYAAVANSNGGLTGIHKSINSGDDFSQVFDGSAKYLLNYYSDGSDPDNVGNSGQGNYDLAFSVKPDDPNTLYLGGINTWKSVNGGASWSIASMWTSYSVYNLSDAPVVHADKHCLKFQNATNLFEGNDGGIYKTIDGGANWSDLSDGLVISQIYRMGLSATNEGTVINGLQDNGSKLLYAGDGSWYDIKSGDGMECLIDYVNEDIQYATYVNGQITRTTNGWSSSSGETDINENIGDGTLDGAWVTPYIIDPSAHNTLYVGYADVWKTVDNGNTFTKISNMNSSENLRSMAIAPSDNSTLYVADQSNIWRTTTEGLIWNNITGTLPTSSNSLTYIAVHAHNPLTLWVTMGGYNDSKVFKSVDGGDSWEDVSEGLPNIPVFTIVQDKVSTDNDLLYVGTDVGVYYKLGNDNWSEFNAGLPNVMVTELEIFYAGNHDNSKLRAATYGRGLWETPLLAIVNTLPFVTSNSLSDVTTTTASFTGNVSSEGQTSVTERGVVWGAKKDPTITDSKVADVSAGLGEYTVPLNALLSGTTYYARGYASNTGGVSYGNNIEFKTSGVAASIEELNNVGIKVFPNPSNGLFKVTFNDLHQDAKIRIQSISGQNVYETEVTRKITSIDLSDNSKGVYFIEISVNKKVYTSKVVLR